MAELNVLTSTELSTLSYLQQVKKFSILSQKEENDFVNSWIMHNDLKSAHRLVTSHLRLVVKIALKFRNYGLPLMDIISEGNIGLMKAVKKFKPEKGNRLSTYAMWWIKASIQDYIVKSWSMIKVGSGVLQKKLFSSVVNFKKKYGNQDNEVEKVNNILKNNYQTISLNEKLGEEEGAEFIDMVSDCTQTHEENIADKQVKNFRIKIMKNAIYSLNYREQDIIQQRKLSESPITLDMLSKKYNVSSERIRQIEESALKKIKNFVRQTGLIQNEV